MSCLIAGADLAATFELFGDRVTYMQSEKAER